MHIEPNWQVWGASVLSHQTLLSVLKKKSGKEGFCKNLHQLLRYACLSIFMAQYFIVQPTAEL